MDLTSNVPQAGPLASISLHVLSFRTAVHLATGAIGWWKARERTRSLSECILSNKAVLVGTTSFNSFAYKEKRYHGFIQGLVVEGGCLDRTNGQIEATAVANDVGVNCLRALTTGLLCFYKVKITTIILADIIPFGLIQAGQDDEVPEFTGPLLTSLTEFVTAVAAEEDCNTFRKYLLQQVSSYRSCLRGATFQDILQCDPLGEQDLHLVIGALRWITIAKYKRPTQSYPTRSLKVWLTAVIMQELGFEISVSLDCVSTTSDYARYVDDSRRIGEFCNVILVTASVGLTDIMMLNGMARQSTGVRPQITTLGGLPYIAFSRLQDTHKRAELEHLVDIWRTSFQSAQKAVHLPVITKTGLVRLDTTSDGTRATRERHKSLSQIWSPYLARILGPPMSDYVPSSLVVESWSPENIEGYFELQARGEGMLAEEEARGNSFKLIAIIQGTIYGIASRSLIPNPSQASYQEFMEVAFQPDLSYSRTLFRWAKVVGEALNGMLELYNWKDFILELATGISLTHLNSQYMPERLGNMDQDMDPAASSCFGAQANGIFAISDFVVRPSSQVNNVLKFHVGTGKILNLPVDEHGFLRSSDTTIPTIDFRTNAGPTVDILRRQPLSHNPLRDQSTRVDAEPDWTGNPRLIQFSVRVGGVLVAKINLGRLIWRLSSSTVTCNCTQIKAKVNVPLSEGWQINTLDQLLEPSHIGSTPCSADVKDGVKIMLDVHGDEMHKIYAVGILHCRRLAISTSCIGCAYKSFKDKTRQESTALIVG